MSEPGDLPLEGPSRPTRLLLEGPPRIGKTTIVTALVALLRDHGLPVGGFITQEELGDDGRRTGFTVHGLGGLSAVLAHVDLTTEVQVGRYKVDVPAFEAVALPALGAARELGGVVVIDEIARMELTSHRFVHAVEDVLENDLAVIATVHIHEHPFTDKLKNRSDIELRQVTHANRGELPCEVYERLAVDLGAF